MWPEVEILLRADSGFCRDEIMSWCENNSVDYVFGLAKNERLERRIKRRMKGARRRFAIGPAPLEIPGVRGFPLPHANQLGAAAQSGGQSGVSGEGRKPAFRGDLADGGASGGATALRDDLLRPGRDGEPHQGSGSRWGCSPTAPRRLYSVLIRSDYIFHRSDTVFWTALRRMGLAGTKMARAQCTTIRLRLLKIGARIRITARKVWISLATGYAWAGVFEQVYENLERGEPQRC